MTAPSQTCFEETSNASALARVLGDFAQPLLDDCRVEGIFDRLMQRTADAIPVIAAPSSYQALVHGAGRSVRSVSTRSPDHAALAG